MFTHISTFPEEDKSFKRFVFVKLEEGYGHCLNAQRITLFKCLQWWFYLCSSIYEKLHEQFTAHSFPRHTLRLQIDVVLHHQLLFGICITACSNLKCLLLRQTTISLSVKAFLVFFFIHNELVRLWAETVSSAVHVDDVESATGQ